MNVGSVCAHLALAETLSSPIYDGHGGKCVPFFIKLICFLFSKGQAQAGDYDSPAFMGLIF